jgi:hypothetical protein
MSVESQNCHGGNWMSIPLTHPLTIKARAAYVVVIDNVTHYAITYKSVSSGHDPVPQVYFKV